jgi:hypothetical protein
MANHRAELLLKCALKLPKRINANDEQMMNLGKAISFAKH